MDGADIVFCPYNYLIDPKISSQMGLQLHNQILVLDEAHNIEDTARESASFTVTQTQLEKACHDIRTMIEFNIKPVEHQKMWDMCSSIRTFLDINSENVVMKSFNTSVKTWGGQDMLARLQHMGLGPDDYQVILRCMCEIVPEHMEEKRHELNSATLSLFEGICLMLKFIYQDGQEYLDSYRLAITKSMVQKPVETDGRWVRRGNKYEHHVEMSLNLWCLNPAVVFSDIKDIVRTIILTSGTLSPMESFQSELGVPFPIQLEANHVIDNNQVWVGSLGTGPKGQRLEATYQIAETFNFQDDLGNLVESVCHTVPHGVLCFLSSYRMLDKLADRWKTVGIWSEIEKRKRIICEPRGSDRLDFDELMSDFYNTIEETQDGATPYGIDGALFMAVCRGKVSEGMDFTDSNARAVITVGIPFPNFKDTQVELKREYNNKYTVSRGILSGSEWYEIQAYRAINQALGRCIRHRNDWGALIMVDARFVRNPNKYTKGLSKWVRNKVASYHNFNEAQDSLQSFVQERQEADKAGISKTSPSLKDTLLQSPSNNASSPIPNGISQSKFCSPYDNLMPRVKQTRAKQTLQTPIKKESGIIDLTESPMLTSTPAVPGQIKIVDHKSLVVPAMIAAAHVKPDTTQLSQMLGHNNLKLQGSGSTTLLPPKVTSISNLIDNNKMVEMPGRSLIRKDPKTENITPKVRYPRSDHTVYIPHSTKTIPDQIQELIGSGQLVLPTGKQVKVVMLKNASSTAPSTSASTSTASSTRQSCSDNNTNVKINTNNIEKIKDSTNSESPSKRITDDSRRTEDRCESPPLFDLDAEETEAMNNISNSSKGHDTDDDTTADQDEQLGGCVKDGIKNRRTTYRKRNRKGGLTCARKRRKQDIVSSSLNEVDGILKVAVNCQMCGNAVFTYKDSEIIEDTPSFLKTFSSKRPTYISSNNDITGLESISSTHKSGVNLNTHWSEDDGCCVMFLKCASCDTTDVVGAKVIAVSDEGKCKYSLGQVYFLGTETS